MELPVESSRGRAQHGDAEPHLIERVPFSPPDDESIMRDRPDPVEPGPDQESVWNYPRPPRLERVERRLRVVHAGTVVADTEDGWRVLETSHPPNYYFPPDDIVFDHLERQSERGSLCEWKGRAHYYDLVLEDERIEQVAWGYDDPTERFEALTGALAFYAHKIDEAWVGDERAEPQPGEFYGGWITSDVVGPFKGEPGTGHW